MYNFWQSWNSFILCLLHHKLCLRLLFYFVFNPKSFLKIQIQAMDLDCDTIFVIVYNFPISLYHWYSTRYRLFSGGFLNKTWKKEEVIWQVPARRCLDWSHLGWRDGTLIWNHNYVMEQSHGSFTWRNNSVTYRYVTINYVKSSFMIFHLHKKHFNDGSFV